MKPELFFAAGNRNRTAEIACSAWQFMNKSRISGQQSPMFIGKLVSLVTAAMGIASSTVSLAGSIAERSPAANSLRLNLRFQNLTTRTAVVNTVQNSNSRTWNSPVILSGQTVVYPFTIGGRQAADHMFSVTLTDETGNNAHTYSFVIRDNTNDIRVTRAIVGTGGWISGPTSTNLRENTPMIFSGREGSGLPVSLYCTSVMGQVNNQEVNIDVSLLN
ncbi:hypothetical protein [Enterobacter hormaechei]